MSIVYSFLILAAIFSRFCASNIVSRSIKFVDQDHVFGEGDACRRRADNVSGYCLPLKDCPLELEALHNNNIRPELCFYAAEIPIACCKQPQPIAYKIKERISEKKCESFNPPVGRATIPESEKTFWVSVVGGDIVNFGEFPHMAALGWTKHDKSVEWNCGGTLISDQFVLTAAHCTKPNRLPDIVRLSDRILVQNNETHPNIDFSIYGVYVHPDYRTNSLYNDIALIRLGSIVKFGVSTRPACLWQLPTINYSAAIATGWGHLEFGGSGSNQLLKVDLNLFDLAKCREIYQTNPSFERGLLPSQLCAGVLAGGKDTCQGDSGGPLTVSEYVNGRKEYRVIGITSFGQFCGAVNTPSIYTRVSSYIEWIESIVWPN